MRLIVIMMTSHVMIMINDDHDHDDDARTYMGDIGKIKLGKCILHDHPHHPHNHHHRIIVIFSK